MTEAIPAFLVEILKALPSWATLGIAYFALGNWRQQELAKKKADFLDSVMDAIHKVGTAAKEMLPEILNAQLSLAIYMPDARRQPSDDDLKDWCATEKLQILARFAEKNLKLSEAKLELSYRLEKGRVFSFFGYSEFETIVSDLLKATDPIGAFELRIFELYNLTTKSGQAKYMEICHSIDGKDIAEKIDEKRRSALTFLGRRHREVYIKSVR